jgi:hypothetical protein
MKTEMFAELLEAAREGLKHARGERSLLTTTRQLRLRKGRPAKRNGARHRARLHTA